MITSALRGCQEFIRLEELDTHVQSCGFAPVRCSNEECGVVVNKLELVHHESSVCEFRKAKCHNCGKIEHDLREMEKKLENLASKENVEQVKAKMEDLASKEDLEQLKAMIVQMFQKFNPLEKTSPTTSGTSRASTLMEDILVAGGWDLDTDNDRALKSVERFSWKNEWKRVSSMKFSRAGATSFVYENRVFVAGGSSNSKIIEVLDLNKDSLEWGELATTLPYPCVRVVSAVYQN